MKHKHWRVNAEIYADRMSKSDYCLRSVTGLSPSATVANAIFWGYAAGYRAAKRKTPPSNTRS